MRHAAKHLFFMLGIGWAGLFLLSPVHAALIVREKAVCPCCGQELSIPIVAESDTKGGVDRDLFARSSSGAQQVYYFAITCPACLFSGYPADFLPLLSKAPSFPKPQQAEIRKMVAPLWKTLPQVPPDGDILKFSGQQRLELAYVCAPVMGRSDEAQAWTALRLAWCWRQENAVLPKRERYMFALKALMRAVPDPSDHNTSDRGVQMADLAASGRVVEGESVADRLIRRCYGAFLYRRHGELPAFKKTTEELRKEMDTAMRDVQQRILTTTAPASQPVGSMEEDLATILAGIAAVRQDLERLQTTVTAEERWLAIAVEHFERAIAAGQISDENQNRGLATYLVGELHRRLGRRDLALQWYDTAGRLELPTDAKRWLAQQRKRAVEMPEGTVPVPHARLPVGATQPTTSSRSGD